MRISVIVPAFDEASEIGATLQSISAAMSAFDARGWSSELIVCDNNSRDQTAAIARAAGARVVFEPVNQISRARNTGAAAATGEWLIFVDADSHPGAPLFDDVAAEILGGRCVAGGSTVTFENPHPALRTVAFTWNTLSRMARWAAGSFIFCKASVFHEVGGFSQDLFAGEEIDLFRRLKRAARARGGAITILHRHPLRTSDRKMRLYTWQEIVGFMLRTVAARGRTLRNQQECYAWYDGRRSHPNESRVPPD
jgi:glycosyltransferase involved in cell wall biosynthesis